MQSKNILFLILSFFIFSFSQAQDSVHVHWSGVAKKTGANQFELKFTGVIDVGWHVYAKANAAESLFGLVIT